MIAAWSVNLAGAILIGLIVWWFWLSRSRATRSAGTGPIEVLVADGVYTPPRIELPAGQSIRLRFLRRDPSPCAEKVVFADLGVSADLPVGEPVEIALGTPPPGEHEFTCQMQMYRGTLVVQESS
jgi:plastocyanin domain-containing protein